MLSTVWCQRDFLNVTIAPRAIRVKRLFNEILTQNILGHSPQLDSNTGNLCEIRWRRVLKVSWVWDPSRRPWALVRWVGDLGNGPFTLPQLSTSHPEDIAR